MKRTGLLLSIFLIGTILFSCAPKPVNPAAKPIAPDAPFKSGEVKKTWQEEWEKTLEAARKEGKVVAITGYPREVTQQLEKAFKERFGIEIEFLSGRGAELRARLFNERRAGLYLIDLQVRGLSGLVADLKPARILDPFEPLLFLPEVREPGNWWQGKLPWVDDEKLIFQYFASPTGHVGFNASIVSSEGFNSYLDMLDRKWKGKIVMNDPTTTGSGNSWFYHVDRYIMGRDYLRALGEQELFITRDQRLMAEWLARGKYAIAIGEGAGQITEMKKLGAPLEEKILKEGGYLSAAMGGLAFVNRAPHPNAAKVFVNWVLTKEAQTMLARAYDRHSLRIDIPTDFLSPDRIRQPGVKYVGSTEEDQLKQAKWAEVASEIWKHLLK